MPEEINEVDDKSYYPIARFLAKQLLLVGGYEADDNTQVLIEELLEKAVEEGNV